MQTDVVAVSRFEAFRAIKFRGIGLGLGVRYCEGSVDIFITLNISIYIVFRKLETDKIGISFNPVMN